MNLCSAGLRRRGHQISQTERHVFAVLNNTALPAPYSASPAMASAGATGPGDPTPRPSLRNHLQYVVGQRSYATFVVRLPQSSLSGFLPP